MPQHKSYEDLPEQMKEKYCEEHEMFYLKNAVGAFVCPFCVSGEA